MSYELERCYLLPSTGMPRKTCITQTPQEWQKIDTQCHSQALERQQACRQGTLPDGKNELCHTRFIKCQSETRHRPTEQQQRCSRQYEYCTQSENNSCQLKNFKDECYLSWLETHRPS